MKTDVRTRGRGFTIGCVLALGAVLLGACGSSTPSTSPTPIPPTAGPFSSATITQASNRGTVQIYKGGTANISLTSVNWKFPTMAPGPLVRIVGPLHLPHMGNCVTGQGCGVTLATFHASKVGTAVIKATRSTCGEAMACAPNNRSWSVTVDVVAH